jgi:hypothetical protein
MGVFLLPRDKHYQQQFGRSIAKVLVGIKVRNTWHMCQLLVASDFASQPNRLSQVVHLDAEGSAV